MHCSIKKMKQPEKEIINMTRIPDRKRQGGILHTVYLLLLIFAYGTGNIQCTDNSASSGNETSQYRFELNTITRGVEGKDSLSILISDLPFRSLDCNGQPVLLPPIKPVVTVNNQQPIPDASDTTFSWCFPPVPAGSIFTYSIRVGTAQIQDTVKVPSAIDSVFCNGKYTQDYSFIIPTTPACTLSWRSNISGEKFIIRYLASPPDTIREIITTDNQMIIPTTGAKPEIGFNIARCESVNTLCGENPDNVKGSLSVYNYVFGPFYSIYVYVGHCPWTDSLSCAPYGVWP
jgi:hypothetical protein